MPRDIKLRHITDPPLDNNYCNPYDSHTKIPRTSFPYRVNIIDLLSCSADDISFSIAFNAFKQSSFQIISTKILVSK